MVSFVLPPSQQRNGTVVAKAGHCICRPRLAIFSCKIDSQYATPFANKTCIPNVQILKHPNGNKQVKLLYWVIRVQSFSF